MISYRVFIILNTDIDSYTIQNHYSKTKKSPFRGFSYYFDIGYYIAVVRDVSTIAVPSDTKLIVNVFAVTVPVARVPVVRNPVPNVIVYDVVPLVNMIIVAVEPAGATAVVYVAVAVGVTFTTEYVDSVIATAPFARAAYGSRPYENSPVEELYMAGRSEALRTLRTGKT
jgi:hypothetical protein